MEQGLQVATAGGDDSDVARVVSRGDRRPPPAAPRVLQGQRGRVLRAHRRALRADQRPRGLVRRLASTRPRTTCATSASTASSPRGAPTSASSRAPRSTRPPTSRAGRAPARSRPRAPRACGSRPSAPAGRARSARSSQELEDGAVIVELPLRRRDWLVREVLKEAGDAAVLDARGREACRCRAAARAAAAVAPLAAGARQADAPPQQRAPGQAAAGLTTDMASEPPRPDPDVATRGFLDRAARRSICATNGPRRLAAPDAALVRACATATPVGLDLREVAEGPQPRARPARHAAGRGRRRVPRAARRDVRVAT